MVGSQRALAKALHRPLSTVRHWMKHESWPFGVTGPWSVEGVRAWAELNFETPGRDGEESSTDLGTMKRRAEVRVLLERGAMLRLTREERENTLHDVAECLDRRLSLLHRFQKRLLELPRMIRRRLTGQREDVIERRLDEALRQILDELADELMADRAEVQRMAKRRAKSAAASSAPTEGAS